MAEQERRAGAGRGLAGALQPVPDPVTDPAPSAPVPVDRGTGRLPGEEAGPQREHGSRGAGPGPSSPGGLAPPAQTAAGSPGCDPIPSPWAGLGPVALGVGVVMKHLEIPLPSLHHPLPFPGRVWPLEILHTNNIATNLHPRWGVSGSRCHGDHLQGPGCLRLSVQPRDQEILSLQLCSCGPASRLWAPCPLPPPGSPSERGGRRHPPPHSRACGPFSWVSRAMAARTPPPSPCGPSAFLTSHGGPEGRQAHP